MFYVLSETVQSDPDHFPYLLQDVLNFNQFSSNLTIEEQQQLLKYLPSVDTARLPDSLKSMFASPQFKENISSFQKLHVEGVFNLSLSEDRKCSSINEGSVVQGGPNAIANGNSTNVKRMRGQLQNSLGVYIANQRLIAMARMGKDRSGQSEERPSAASEAFTGCQSSSPVDRSVVHGDKHK
ncbi:hypothetical protein RHGRI_005901 [Rhododendron griersonianum]|uniref:DEUBAD domain-containing protein n=1 Tax=Rhododendron griersonianum TaxID=479676 RepID=A0AAV6LH96_9ERIC|nr:hypothetical protein RHGRI_005901 [Rhododendron griersonianum]